MGLLLAMLLAAAPDGGALVQVRHDGPHGIRPIVRFDAGSARPRAEAKAVLDEVAAALRDHPEILLAVEGHADNVGEKKTAVELAKRRAGAVVAELVKRGISADRLSAVGYGSERPLANNAVESERALNRRVELTIAPRSEP